MPTIRFVLFFWIYSFFPSNCFPCADFILKAKYGFWESLHLFSSLSLLLLVKLINRRWPQALGMTFLDEDEDTYVAGRGTLQEMSSVGNFASNDHLKMLRDIENLDRHAQEMSIDTEFASPDFLFDIAEWQNMFLNTDTGANEVDIPWSLPNIP
jgi:proline utilization trans-activator